MVNYCCTRNEASAIKSHNNKLIKTFIKSTLPCNCRKKNECLLDGKCRAENIAYKCLTLVEGYPNKIYLAIAEGDFKQRFYNQWIQSSNEAHSRDTTFFKYVCET